MIDEKKLEAICAGVSANMQGTYARNLGSGTRAYDISDALAHGYKMALRAALTAEGLYSESTVIERKS